MRVNLLMELKEETKEKGTNQSNPRRHLLWLELFVQGDEEPRVHGRDEEVHHPVGFVQNNWRNARNDQT